MITTTSKWYFGVGALSLVLALAYGWSTGGNGLGPVTAGYKGGVGDHLGYGVLLAIAVVAIVLGVLAVVTRDADGDALAQLAATETAPPAAVPVGASYWPLIGAFAVGLTAVGLAVSPVLFVIGLLLGLVTLVEWAVLNWSDRATGDPATNRALRDRLMSPFEVPIAGFLGIGVLAVAISRIFLTSSKLGAVWVACAFAVAVLAIGALVAVRPRISPNLVAAVLVLGALATVVGGIAAGARGERTFHSVTGGHGEEGEDHAEPRIRVRIPGATGIGEVSSESGPPTPPTTAAPGEGAR